MLPLPQLWTTLQGHPFQLQSFIQFYEAFTDCITAQLSLLTNSTSFFLSNRCWCQEHSLIQFSHTNLHLRVCFLENSTIDSWARSGQRANIKIGSSKVQLAMRTPPLIIDRTHIFPGTGNRETVRKLIKKAGEFRKNIYFCFTDYAKTFDCVDHKKIVENYERDGNTRPPDLLLRNLYAGQEATVRTGHGTTDSK